MKKLYVDIRRNLPGFSLNVSFEADENCLALLGSSGSGKSMTLRCIAGIERPDEGVIRLGERVLFDSKKRINLPPQQRKIGYLFQNYALFSHMTVEGNIEAGLGDVPRSERGEIIEAQLKQFQIEKLRDRYPRELSGGQQQRVALARVMAYKPEILMLDEPFSALDSYLRWQLEPQMIQYLHEYSGVPLYVSHNRDEAYRICSRIAVLDKGKIVVMGDKKAVFTNPRTRAAAVLTGCKNISPAHKTGEYTLYAQEWGVELRGNTPVPDGLRAVGLRAHFMHSAAQAGENTIRVGHASVSEAPFSVAVLFATTQGQLRWEIDRSEWAAHYEGRALPDYVRVAPEGLLYLEEE